MGLCIAFDADPLSTACDMLPEFGMGTSGIFADIDRIEPGLLISIQIGDIDGRIAAIIEFDLIAWTAMGAG